MKTVITYGTFDLLHIGHINLLKRCRNLGDRLVVAISTDEFNASKGKESRFSFHERYEIVSSLQMVDVVIEESCWEQKIDDIHKYAVKIFCMGSDWEGKFDYLRQYVNVVYLPRTPKISSSQLRGEADFR
jgi:glycerol-3-phosphate cytidylyltransferase